jgi:hypothetical protein
VIGGSVTPMLEFIQSTLRCSYLPQTEESTCPCNEGVINGKLESCFARLKDLLLNEIE